MSTTKSMVYLLDDEPEIIKALSRLLRANELEVRGFTSVRAFLEMEFRECPSCLVLDVAMPEMDGLEIQQRLADQGSLLPIVFLTGHGNVPMSVQAMKSGATDFLTKPVDATALLDAVHAALQESTERLRARAEMSGLRQRLATLTPRQREVLEHIVAGRLNKQIAGELGTGIQNIKLHRAHIMKKMGVTSLAELVRSAERLGVGKDNDGDP